MNNQKTSRLTTYYLLPTTPKIYIFAACLTFLMACQPKKATTMLHNFPDFDVEGHRGCRGLLPENTLPAFQKALDLGCTTLELDVVITADNQVIVSHEPWLSHEFCADSKGQAITEANEREHNLYRMTFAQISACDCGLRPHPRFEAQTKMPATKPLLSQVFELGEKSGKKPFYNVEIKRVAAQDGVFHPEYKEFADLVLAQIAKSEAKERVIIQCFDLPTLRYVRQTAPHIPLALLVETSEGIEKDVANLGFRPDIFSPYFPLVDAQMVAYAKKANIRVVPWTVNEIEDIEKLISLQIDGIISDYPDRLTNFLKKK
jgi:glycerophosphoryl diester phosphodiesterase